jgi:hypothetical protein
MLGSVSSQEASAGAFYGTRHYALAPQAVGRPRGEGVFGRRGATIVPSASNAGAGIVAGSVAATRAAPGIGSLRPQTLGRPRGEGVFRRSLTTIVPSASNAGAGVVAGSERGRVRRHEALRTCAAAGGPAARRRRMSVLPGDDSAVSVERWGRYRRRKRGSNPGSTRDRILAPADVGPAARRRRVSALPDDDSAVSVERWGPYRRRKRVRARSTARGITHLRRSRWAGRAAKAYFGAPWRR